MGKDRIEQIEAYVQRSMKDVGAHDLGIAHDYKHVDRVRCWALQIARGEGFDGSDLVQAAALLHDVGLAHVERRNEHAQAGAEIAARFLHQHQLFADPEVDAIVGAIRCHSSLSGGGMLGVILRDADILDAVGAVGILRAFTSKYATPEYDPGNVKGDTWGVTARGFDQRFAEGKGIGGYIVDQVNFQISLYGNLGTETAKRIAGPLVEFMKAYVIQLESEIDAGRNGIPMSFRPDRFP